MTAIDLQNTLLLGASFLVLFGVAELLYHKLGIKAELTRKLVHVGTGLLTLLFPILLNNHWLVLLLCSSFAAILILSLRFNLLRSINAIDRKSVGSLAYPLAVYMCYLAFDFAGHNLLYYYLPVLILAICDPVAALTGRRWPLGPYRIGQDKKTTMGSSMFFIAAMLLSALLITSFTTTSLSELFLMSIIVSVASCFTEAVSPRGIDNVTIPASVLLVLFVIG